MFKSNDDGFTLLEMMAVLLIMGVIGTIIFISVRPAIDQSSATKARADIDRLSQAVEMYRLTMGQYPEELADLVVAPRDSQIAAKFPRGGFVKALSQDPWRRDYVYLYPGENDEFDIYSFGADGEEGGEGLNADVTSWTR